MAKPPMIPGESKEDRRRRLVAQSAKRYRAKQRSKATADRQNAARAAAPAAAPERVEQTAAPTERRSGRSQVGYISLPFIDERGNAMGTGLAVGLGSTAALDDGGGGLAGFLDRRDAERELPGNPPVRIEYDGTHGAGTLTLDVLDSSDIARRADLLADEGLGHTNDLRTILSRAIPGSTVRLYLDEPEATLREHETGHGLPVTFTPEMLAR